jgi:hypothetical protein
MTNEHTDRLRGLLTDKDAESTALCQLQTKRSDLLSESDSAHVESNAKLR